MQKLFYGLLKSRIIPIPDKSLSFFAVVVQVSVKPFKVDSKKSIAVTTPGSIFINDSIDKEWTI